MQIWLKRAELGLVGATILVWIATIALIFFYAPVEQSMGIVQKIFYLHVPSAMATYAGFVLASVASLIYLMRPRRGWDIAAVAGVEVGLIFCLYVMLSGPLWAYKAWGKAWVWDPQLTATFVMFLMYGGYFLLRAFSGKSERVRKLAAVLAVIAAINIPIVHWAVKKWGGLHPVVEREGGDGLASEIAATFGLSMLAFLLLCGTLLWLRIKIGLREEQLNELFVDAEDYARSASKELA